MEGKKYYNRPEDLKRALESIKSGTPCATAAKVYRVPRTTLIGKIKGRFPEECKSGASPVLSLDEENVLSQWEINISKMGFPVTKSQLLESVELLVKKLKRPNPFSERRPKRHWYEAFLRRHPEIGERMAHSLCVSRAAVSVQAVKKWFQEIRDFFNSVEVNINEPERPFNTDESAFFMYPNGNRVLAKRGTETVYERSGDEKECLTVLITGNAAGHLAPPMVMYSYERIALSMPTGWGIGRSESGWMTSESFYEYISNIFYPWLVAQKIKFPVLLYVDGRKSHITSPLSEFCREKNIILISLLPNSTHILQPLDVGFFKAPKNSWKKATNTFKSESKQRMNKTHFAGVLKNDIEQIQNKEDIFKNAFRVCGLYPFNEENVDYSKIISNEYVEHIDTDNKTVDNKIVDYLRFIENEIDANLVKEFYNRKGENWYLDEENRGLYNFWLKIFKKTGLSLEEARLESENEKTIEDMNESLASATENETDSIIIEVEEGLELDEGWQDRLIDDSSMFMKILETTSQEKTTTIFEISGNQVEEKRKDNEEQSLGDQPKENIVQNEIEEIELTDVLAPAKENLNQSDTDQNDALIHRNGTKSIIEDVIDFNDTDSESDIPLALLVKRNKSERTPKKNADTTKPDTNERCSKFLPGINVPSPFKKALFWPEIPISHSQRKKKEKIPSVTTSDAWCEYHRKKTSKKERINNEKEERKRKREQKKADEVGRRKLHKTRAVKEKIKKSQREKKSQILATKKVGNAKLKVINEKPEVGHHVIINFEGDLYPGIITDLRESEALISAMKKTDDNYWKWPETKDEIWYKLEEIEDVIEPPELKGDNLFIIKEIEDFL